MTRGRSDIRKRSLSVAGHRTSISLETPFWDELGRIARARGMSVQALVARIDAERTGTNLSSALRLFVLDALRGASPGPT